MCSPTPLVRAILLVAPLAVAAQRAPAIVLKTANGTLTEEFSRVDAENWK